MIKYIDLFCGVGGFHLGLKNSGDFEYVMASDIDKFARQTYTFWHGVEPRGDITKINSEDIPDHDLLVGGFPCFIAGSLVLTSQGYKEIQEIEVGDKVLTHLGRWRSVTSLMKKEDAPCINFKKHNITCTKEHPFYIRRRISVKENKTTKRTFNPPEWLEAEKLSSDTFTSQIYPTEEIEDDKSVDFWWLIGRFLGDGWTIERKDRIRGGKVIICCDYKEAEFLNNQIIKAGFHSTRANERTAVKFHISKNDLYYFCCKFGRYAHGKFLTHEALSLNKEKSLALLNGYLSADGHLYKHGWSACSVSEKLILGFSLLAQKCYEVTPRVSKCVPIITKQIEGRIVKQKPRWILEIPNSNNKNFIDGCYSWRMGEEGKVIQNNTVYNISVEEDESYTVNNTIVHNCQSYSISGQRNGLNDDRGMLIYDILRIARDKETPILLLENVKNLIHHDKGETWKVIKGEFEELGYYVNYQVINANLYVPQNRERVFILATKKPNNFDKFVPTPATKRKNLIDILEENVDNKYTLSDIYWKSTQLKKAKHLEKGNGFCSKVLNPEIDKTTGTFPSGYKREILIYQGENKNPRKLTPREAARLMGFPDDLPIVVSDKRAYMQFGNSLCPLIIKDIANFIKNDKLLV